MSALAYACRADGARLGILRSDSDRVHNTQPAPPEPRPLATLPPKLPIVEVIAQLQELQAQHPDATEKRGRANRWEL